MAIPLRSMNGKVGPELVLLHACTLADYTAGGTTTPTVGDYVTFSTTGNWYVKAAADNDTKRLGVVRKIELAPSGSAVGYVVVEWLDAVRTVEVPTDDLTTTALGNSLILDGAGTAQNFDAGATTGLLICVAESASSGSGTATGILFTA